MNTNDITKLMFPIKINLNNDKIVILRLLSVNDGQKLGRYFSDLSEITRKLFGPHPLNLEEGIKICNTLHENNSDLLIVAEEPQEKRIIAYFILHLGIIKSDKERYANYNITLYDSSDCTLAPSLADDYQNKSLGSKILQNVILLAKDLDKRRMILMGGVKAENLRAVHFYEKFSFRIISEFEYQGMNYDMMLDIE
jgi:diamine N-acetyltransferase